MDELTSRKYELAGIPRVYWQRSYPSISKYIDLDNILRHNIIIYSVDMLDGSLFLATLLKCVGARMAGTHYYKFENVVEQLKSYKYMDVYNLMDVNVSVGIDGINLGYFTNYKDSMVTNVSYKQFFALLKNVLFSVKEKYFYLSVVHTRDDFYSMIPRNMIELFKKNFISVML